MASQINTTGLIAENISANEIVGKTLTGSIINGAVLNGAVVRASYLDLDGQLEVLTNYHITPAMYTANPSLYIDAVYITGSNEHRIPSLSTISEATVSYQTNSTAIYYGVMSSYNTANAGNNLKAVKIRPSFSNQVGFTMIDSTCSDEWFSSGFTYGIKNHFVLKLGIGTLSVNTIVSQGSWASSESSYSFPNKVQVVCSMETGTVVFPTDWLNGRLSFQQVVAPKSSPSATSNDALSPIKGLTQFALNQSLYINNML